VTIYLYSADDGLNAQLVDAGTRTNLFALLRRHDLVALAEQSSARAEFAVAEKLERAGQ
jgi:hypothetical protein